ncbi:unnamed protein product [Vitrella brassicaformis CCMP3155]|uniref:Uncharacterized protein n=2 Tax=Vitrella brassicaformis TaxID=1169539 RepID=A0A0G4GKP7_VITBC|nr:unnamed protein product [Vitrella brassicaformis CCMP3155]|eukprot:CEM30588.1 unnamed protein product [Vitrella brassicaformis CCMP3155]
MDRRGKSAILDSDALPAQLKLTGSAKGIAPDDHLQPLTSDPGELRVLLRAATEKLGEVDTLKERLEAKERELQQRRVQHEKLQAEYSTIEHAHKTSEHKVDRYGKLQKVIVDLYLELRSRTWEGPKALDVEKDRLALMVKDPVVVLDYIRAGIRILLADAARTQEQIQREMQQQGASLRLHAQQMEEQFHNMTDERAAALNDVQALSERVDELEREKERTHTAHQKVLEDIDKERCEFKDKIREYKDEINLLNTWNAEHAKKLKEQESQLDRIPHLEQQVASLQRKHLVEVHQLQTYHARENILAQKEIGKIAGIEAENTQLQKRFKHLRQELHSAKHNLTQRRHSEAEARCRRLEEALTRRSKDLQTSEQALRKSLLKLERRDRQLEQMKQEYTKLLDEFKKLRAAQPLGGEKAKTLAYSTSTPDLKASGEEGAGVGGAGQQPFLATVLKRKLLDREQEIVNLNRKLRNFLVIEKKAAIQSKVFEDERHRMEQMIDDYRTQLTESEEKVAKLHQSLSKSASAAQLHTATKDMSPFDAAEDDTHTLSSAAPPHTPARHTKSHVSLSLPGEEMTTTAGRGPPQMASRAGSGGGDGSGSVSGKRGRPTSAVTGKRLPLGHATGATSTLVVGSMLGSSAVAGSRPPTRPHTAAGVGA